MAKAPAYVPGTITVESTYVFVCSGCSLRGYFPGTNYDDGKRMAREAGWHNMTAPWKDLPGGWTCSDCYVEQWEREDARGR